MPREIQWVGFTINGDSYLLDLKNRTAKIKTDEGWEEASEIEFVAGTENQFVFNAHGQLNYNLVD